MSTALRSRALRSGTTLAASIAVIVLGGTASAQTPFLPGDLVVSRDGTGAIPLTSAATAVFLDEYNATLTNIAPVQSIALPTTPTGNNFRFTDSGSASSDGALTLSGNGQYLTLGGYDSAPGTPGVVATTVNRIVARVGANGTVDTSTALTGTYSGNNIRSVASTNGSTLITAGSGTATDGGVRSAPFGTTTPSTQLESAALNARVANLFGGNTYFSAASGAFKGIYQVGTTAATVPTQIAADTSAGGAYDFFFADANTLYVADNTSGILKFTNSGSGFGTGTLIGATQAGLTGLTGTTINGLTTLYTVAPTKLFSLVDNGAGAASTYNTLATAATNEAFRGVDFAPSAGVPVPAAPEPSQVAGLGFFALGLAGVLLKARRRQNAA